MSVVQNTPQIVAEVDDKRPPWRKIPRPFADKRPWKRGLSYTDWPGFIKWIKYSYPTTYRIIVNGNAIDTITLPDVLQALHGELSCRQSARKQAAVRLIYEIGTALHHDPFAKDIKPELKELVFNDILKCLSHSDPGVKQAAIKTLSIFLDSHQQKLIATLIDVWDGNDDVDFAISAIGLIGEVEINLRSRAVPSLVSSLGHTDQDVRIAACDALRCMGHDSLPAADQLM